MRTTILFRAALTVFLFLLALTAPAQISGPGSALSLDGVDDYVAVPAGSNWFNGDFTIEGWVYVRSYNNWSRLLDFSNGGDVNEVYLALSGGTGGYPTLGVLLGGPRYTITASQQLPLDQWTHLAATLSGTTGTIYINGTNVGSGFTLSPYNAVLTNNFFGRSAFAGDTNANAMFDEIRIWRGARTQAQIQQGMNHALSGSEANLVGYWRFDEDAGLLTADFTGHSTNAMLVNGPTWVPSGVPISFGPNSGPGTALNLNGTNNGYVQIPGGVWFNGNFTVEGWVFVRSYKNWSRLIDFSDGPNTNNVYLALSGGTGGFPYMGVFTNNNGSPIISSASTQLPTNQWAHLAATLNGTTGTIYINGVNVGTGTLNVPPNVIRTNNYIGRSAYWAIGDQDADALFDEVRIWNVARTQSQIQADMRRSLSGSENGLIGYWRFDDATGTIASDATGLGNPGTLVGGTLWTNSTAPMASGGGGAVSFNTSQTGSVTNQSALNTYPLTVMTWFKAPSSGGALVNKYASSSFNGWQIFITGGNLVGWYFRNSGNNVFSGGPMNAGPVADNKWHHAAMVIDASGGRLYVDGVQKTTLPWSGTPGPPTTTLPLSFNIYQGDSLGTAQLDETSVWNTNLTTAQIQQFMNNPPIGNEPGLLGCWRFDEGTGTNVADITGHGYNATLQGNPTWVASGVPVVLPDAAYALRFNGSNTYAQVNGFGNVAPTNEITIEFWQRVTVAANQSALSINPDNVANRINVQTPWSNGHITWDFGNINTTGRLDYMPSNSPVGSWQHFAFVASQSGNYMAVYRNGVLEAQKAGMTPYVRENKSLVLGTLLPYAYCFNGDLDEVRIWYVARSQAAIQANMNRPLTGKEPGLLAYYRLDEGAGTNLVDSTGNGNNGFLVGGGTNTLPQWERSGATVGFPLVASTLPASQVTLTSAVLNAAISPNGQPGTATLIWGTNTSYGNTNTFAFNGTVAVTLSNVLTGLPPGTLYHFQLIAATSTETNVGGDLTFSTLGAAPVVVTQPASGLTTIYPILTGTVTPGLLPSTAWFEWGTNTAPYENTNAAILLGATNVPVDLSNMLSGLPAATLFHFRLVATNLVGFTAGDDATFTTIGSAPTIGSTFSSGTTPHTAMMNGAVAPNGLPTMAWFVWGTNSTYGNTNAPIFISETNGTAFVAISNLLTGLTPQVGYQFKVIATNQLGTTVGGAAGFSPPGGKPFISVTSIGGLTTNSATLSAQVYPNFLPTTAWFEWGSSTTYGNTNFIGDIGSGTSLVLVTSVLSNLPPGMTNHFRAVATNSFGAAYSDDLPFITGGGPIVTTSSSYQSSVTAVALDGYANPNGLPTTAYFEYGTTTNFGTLSGPAVDAGSGNTDVAYENIISNLPPGTLYYFRAVGHNSLGFNIGATMTFTSPAFAPTLSQPQYVSNALSGLLFQVVVSPNGAATQVYFEWGADAVNRSTVTNFPAGMTNSVTIYVSGPSLQSVFPYRFIARNTVGLVYGSSQFFNAPSFTLNGSDPQLLNCSLASDPGVNISDSATNVAVAAGEYHSLVLHLNGTVDSWGSISNVPPEATNVVKIAAGYNFNLALRSDGRIIAWGANDATNVPVWLNNAAMISVQSNHCLAATSDGYVTEWGPGFPANNSYYGLLFNSIAAGSQNLFLATTANGTYVGGDNTFKQWNLFGGPFAQVVSGRSFAMGLTPSRTIFTSGDNTYGQRLVPANAQGAVAIAAGEWHALALLTNGTVVAWGKNDFGQTNVPAGLNGVVAIAAGAYHSLAVRSNGQVVAWGRNLEGQTNVPTTGVPFSGTVTTNVTAGTYGTNFLTYNATNILGIGASLARTVVTQEPMTLTLATNVLLIPSGVPFTDPGATAISTCKGDVSSNVVVTGTVDTSKPGSYLLNYSITNLNGQLFTRQRSVIVDHPTPPQLTIQSLPGSSNQIQFSGTRFLSYTLQASSNLTDWFDVSNVVADPLTNFQFDAARSGTNMFFRARSP